jgi:phosphoribosyl-ATP pyrophosphohydrolase/phosphoribosyl-AMP cyclohydrolase
MPENFIHNIKADERGLIAAVVQDSSNSEILALCYLDNATLAATLNTGRLDSLSRKIPEVVNGETKLVDVRANLDGHSLTIIISRESVHAGASEARSLLEMSAGGSLEHKSAADVALVDVGSMDFGVAINELYKLIEQRRAERPDGSYTTYLFNSGLDKILKKIAEESGEVIIAAKNKQSREIVSEMADLFYHLLVLMVEREVKLSDVQNELAQRSKSGKKQIE